MYGFPEFLGGEKHLTISACCRNDGATIALGGASPPPGASGQQRAVVCRATSAVDPLRAPCPVGSPHHAPPARFWQATLAGASSAPRPNLASTLREPHVPGRRHPMAMSDGLPGSPSCSDKEDPVDQDEEHLRHRVQNWLEAAIAVSGRRTSLFMHGQQESWMQITIWLSDLSRWAHSVPLCTRSHPVHDA